METRKRTTLRVCGYCYQTILYADDEDSEDATHHFLEENGLPENSSVSYGYKEDFDRPRPAHAPGHNGCLHVGTLHRAVVEYLTVSYIPAD